MPKFAANLMMLFTEVPFMDRFSPAGSAGFRCVEYSFPYANRSKNLKAALDHHGLEQVLFNLPAGDWTAGDRARYCSAARPQKRVS